MNPNSTASSSYLPLIGRLLLAAIFLVSGVGKLANPAGTIGYIASVGLPAPAVGYAAALIVELVGGAMLLVGYRTRLVTIVLTAFCLVSALIFHNALGDQNQLFHFLKNVAMAGGLLQVFALGAGSLSIDQRRAVASR